MKKMFKKIMCYSLMFVIILGQASVMAAEVSQAPEAQSITITNNAGIPDVIKVNYGLCAGEIVRVYTAATGGKMLGFTNVSNNKTDAAITLSQLGSAGGSIYISVASKGMLESQRVRADFDPEPQTLALSADSIYVENNVGTYDTVYVTGVSGGDIVRIYNAPSAGKLFGTGTVPANKTEITVKASQLGSSGGSIYVSVTSKGMLESEKVKVDYTSELQSIAPSLDCIYIENNVGSYDNIYVSGVAGGDTIKVYNAAVGGKLLGSATVATNKIEGAVKIAQMGNSAGTVYIAVMSKGMLESSRVAVKYNAELKSKTSDSDYIYIVNNSGTGDTITVGGVSDSDVIKVYDSPIMGRVLGTATVGTYASDATIKINQLGLNGGTVYIAVTSKNKLESERVKLDFTAEGKSAAVKLNNIVVVNNIGTSDTITVTGLIEGDVIKVYDDISRGNQLGTATVANSKTEAVVSISQLGSSSGSVYVSVTNNGLLESEKVKISYAAESVSGSLSIENISISNNSGTNDSVTVRGLTEADTIKIFNSAVGGTLLGSATVASGKTDVAVSISQLGTNADKIYVSLIKKGMLEGDRIEVEFSGESTSIAPQESNILIANKAGVADTIFVSGILEGDVIKVYDAASGGIMLGTQTAGTSKTEVTVTIEQLGITAGDVYLTKTSKNKMESTRTKVSYPEEGKSTALKEENISINNNANASDVVTVEGLAANDIVAIYDSLKGGTLIGAGTVGTYATSVAINVDQLGNSAGSVFVTVTSEGSLESERTKVDYTAESGSIAPSADNVNIINNAGTSDVVEIYGLVEGDTVKIYNSAKGGDLIGSSTVAANTFNTTINITQLGSSTGSIYVSTTSKSKAESGRVKADYAAELQSAQLNVDNIIILNNSNISDSIQITGLNGGDVVNVYDAIKGSNLLGTATVDAVGSQVTISITQLGINSGSVYISVKNKTKLESERIQIDYIAEQKSDILNPDNVSIYNNAGIQDAVEVTGISEGDIVKVYNAEKGGNLLGSGTVDTYYSDVAIDISQLGSEAGSVYLAVIRSGKLESDRIKVEYAPEPKSASSDVDCVIITNNVGMADTIQVVGVSEGDLIKVFDKEKSGTLLGSTYVQTGSAEAVVSISQLGSSAGYVYISVTRSGKLESVRTKVCYSEEAQSDAPATSNISITNNAGKSDKIKVNFLEENDIVKIYNAESAGTLLGMATVASSSTEATVQISQLGSSAGTVYVTVTKKGRKESSRTKAYYSEEAKSEVPTMNNINVANNVQIADTVKVSYLNVDDVVKVYDALTDGNLLGSEVVTTGSAEATIKISQLGAAAGAVYISVTSTGKLESDRATVYYAEEQKSDTLSSNNIIVTNNAGLADTVKVTFLNVNDLVKIYDSETGGNLLGSTTLTSNSGSAEVTFTISQLGTAAGNIYVSVTSVGKLESDRTKVYYTEEVKSDAPSDSNIVVTNNAGMSDIIQIGFLNTGDIVKIYDAATGGKILGTGTVADDSTDLTIKISQLGTQSGCVYVSIVSTGKYESDRTKAYFTEETKTYAPLAENVAIVNNKAGTSDVIKVTGLQAQDLVKVYNAAANGSLLGTAYVANGYTEATIRISQLGTLAGSIYISVTSTGSLESDRTMVDYKAE